MVTEQDRVFLERAVELSRKGITEGQGGPFGCVIVKEGVVVGEGYNKVTSTNDPTAHAEVVAIRDACKKLNTYQLNDCVVYTSCEPCPMCLGAIYWARPVKVVFANTRQEAAAIEFDDNFIYEQINTRMSDRKILFVHSPLESALSVFAEWKGMTERKRY